MTKCYSCQGECDTLVSREDCWLCAACVRVWEANAARPHDDRVVRLLTLIAESLNDLLLDPDTYINVHVNNEVQVTGSVTSYDPR